MATGPEGLEKFMDLLEQYEKAADENNVANVLMIAGTALAEDVHRLPKPRRRGAGYTHMLDSVVATPSGKDAVLVSWGRHYGKFVEYGTKKMSAQPHMIPEWDRNKERYYKMMQDNLFAKVGG
jgi:HK97 gp10 family phage protein